MLLVLLFTTPLSTMLAELTVALAVVVILFLVTKKVFNSLCYFFCWRLTELF